MEKLYSKKIHLGRYIVWYTVGNLVLRRRDFQSDDIQSLPPQMKIVNLIISILMHFCSFVSNWALQVATICDVFNDGGYMWPVTRKGTSWVSYSEIHFFRFFNREFFDESRNISMLVGS